MASAQERAARRLFDGAPPTIPHAALGASCTSCHNTEGRSVPGHGFAPPSPHAETRGLSAMSNCRQCHVAVATDSVFVANAFTGVPQDLRAGERAFDGSPPVMPHGVLMRENCSACHAGPTAREAIRTDHPERTHCAQCHVRQEVATAQPPEFQEVKS